MAEGASAALPVALLLLFGAWAVLGAASLGVFLWGLIDAAMRPEWAYRATGANKVLWIVLIAVLGAIPAIIYLAAIRPKVRAAEDAMARSPYVVPPADARAGGAAPWPPGACGRCGGALLAGARFCGRCGAPTA